MTLQKSVFKYLRRIGVADFKHNSSYAITNMTSTCVEPNTDSKENFVTVEEGQAKVIIESTNNVFYNPVQQFNRDVSTAVLTLLANEKLEKLTPQESHPQAGKKYENGIRILEALSATGLRSIRYAKEVPGVKEVVANDISEKAVKSIRKNVVHNGVEELVTTTQSDAGMLMYQNKHPKDRFDAIDLDPYGCPSQFLDSAVQAVADGGLLLVTSTDMAVLAGNTPETCYVKYGAVSLRIRACHEMGLRILLQCIEAHANRYGRYIVPLLSLSVDFYIRVFVRVFSGPVHCKRTTSKLSMVFSCVGCESVTLQPLGLVHQHPEKPHIDKFSLPSAPPVGVTCEHCGHKHRLGGPIWSANIHDMDFVSRLETIVQEREFGTKKRMQGMLALVSEELPDVPLYYTVDKLCSTIRSETMSLLHFRSALLNAGYRVSLSHAHKNSVKTDAPVSFLWDVMRTWEQSHPVRRDRLPSHAAAILSRTPAATVSFDLHEKANPESRQMGLVRFQENPQRYWGPGTRAKASLPSAELPKRKKNQGKRHRSKSTSPSGKHFRDDASSVPT